MNPTVKSLLFWVVLVVVGVLIWNFSTKLQQHERTISFSELMSWADRGDLAPRQMAALAAICLLVEVGGIEPPSGSTPQSGLHA